MQREAVLAVIAAAQADNEGIDLTEADLSGLDLRGLNFTDADLDDANLFGANLCDANLSDAFLAGADLRGADLRGADLSGAFLSGALLSGARLQGARLHNTYLAETDLTSVYLSGVNLTVADMEKLPPLADDLAQDSHAIVPVAHRAADAIVPRRQTSAAARRLPALDKLMVGPTLPVRLGEEFSSRYATRFLTPLVAVVIVAYVVVGALVIRSYIDSRANFMFGGKVNLLLAILSFLTGPAVIFLAMTGFASLFLGPLWRHRRREREELATVVELSQETVAPGESAQLFVELRRTVLVERIEIWLVCWEVEQRSNTNLRHQSYARLLHSADRMVLAPGDAWQELLDVVIPRDAQRHNFDPASATWINWAIEVRVKCPGATTQTQTFPFRVE